MSPSRPYKKSCVGIEDTLSLVPRTSTLVARILEEEGVLGDVSISSYNLQFIPIAEDVISLKCDDTFKDGDEDVV
ncbi:hypothetical protein SCLCIDRAFT_29201 [Scleroderma citrinum Foug A]|uniref:Uncharacterized protein n=1 Tax=Scleroderma citrinum Foug A TaxID=1036808 RepID=A0A0C3D7Y8_9AGAM|nr:hypothetical protein SCLCIDRAFT_29201 [Scleroderma citrinum Foug A]